MAQRICKLFRIREKMADKSLALAGADILFAIIDEQGSPGFKVKAIERQLVDGRIGFDQLFDAGNHDIAEMIDHRGRRSEALPKLNPEIGDGKQRHISRGKLLDQGMHARNGSGDRFKPAIDIGFDQPGMVGKFGAEFSNHGRKGTAGIMLSMPVKRHHIFKKPVTFLLIWNQLFEEKARIPAIKDVADVKDDSCYGH